MSFEGRGSAVGQVRTWDGTKALWQAPSAPTLTNKITVTVTTVHTAPAPTNAEKFVLVNAAAPTTQTLPTAPADSTRFTISDISAAGAGTNNITIAAGAGDTISGQTIIASDKGSLSFIYNAATTQWVNY